MTGKRQVSCECGALYERTEEKLTYRDIDTFECRFCGSTLERWSGSRIPVFRLVKEPSANVLSAMRLKRINMNE